LLVYALFYFCARHAWRERRMPGLWELGAGVGFGVLLEWATIQQLHAYQYGQFLIMFAEVPLAVGVGWGVIIYSARLFSGAASLPEYLRPVLDGLLALNIDLSMDAIAIRLGMWEWGIPRSAEYFGVPYANFWAWFWVVCSFSAGLRLVGSNGGRRWLAPIGGVAVGMMVVVSTNQLIVSYIPHELYLATIITVIGGALALVLAVRPKIAPGTFPSLGALVPLAFHLYFLSAGTLSGIFVRHPFLLAISLLMAGIALMLHQPWKFRSP
jgi:hypothetical protein